MTNGWDDEHLSDLSEISDSDDDEKELLSSKPAPPPPPTPPVPSLNRKTRPTAKASPAKGKGRGRPAKIAKPDLSQPRQCSYSVELLYKNIVSGKIDLDPEYQRPIVWTDQKQEMLIDSIFNNYPILPFIFAVHLDEETGEKRKTCIDGKQRLTSIFRFLKGEIAHKNPKNGRRMFASQPPAKKTVKVHPQGWLDAFTEQQVLCLEYQDLEPEVEREIFQRVQNGVVLAPHHRLPAANGPNATLIRSIRDEIQQYSAVASYISPEKSKVFQAVARGAYLIFYDRTPSYLEPTPLRLEKWLNNKDTERKTTTIADTVKDAFRIVFRHMQDKKLRSVLEKLSPWEFSFLVYITHLVRQKVTDHQLSEIFSSFRQRAGELLETRVTKEVFKRVLKIVKELTSKDQLPAGSVANSAALTPFHPIYAGEEEDGEQAEEQRVAPEKEPEVVEKAASQPTRASNPRKRKRSILSEDEDDLPLAAAPKRKIAKSDQCATRIRRNQVLPSPTASPVVPPSVPKACQPQSTYRTHGVAAQARETTTSAKKTKEPALVPSLSGSGVPPQKDRLAAMRDAKKLATRALEEYPFVPPSTSSTSTSVPPPPPPSSASSLCHLPTPTRSAGSPPPPPTPSSSATGSSVNAAPQPQHPLPRARDVLTTGKARLPSYTKVEQDKMRYSPPPMYSVKSFPTRAGAGGAPAGRTNGGSTGSIASVESTSQNHSNTSGNFLSGQSNGPAMGSHSDSHRPQQQATGSLPGTQSAAARCWPSSAGGRTVS